MGDTTGQHVARPRIRQTLRAIAFGLVLLPMLALFLLVRPMIDADREAKLQTRRKQVQAVAELLKPWLGGRADLILGERREYFTLREGAKPTELVEPIVVDGRCADWHGVGFDPAGACRSAGVSFNRVELLAGDSGSYDPQDFSFTIRTGTRKGYLYVFVHVVDDEITFRRRGFDEGDQLRLVVSVPGEGGVSLPARFVVALEREREGGVSGVTTYQVDRAWRRELSAPARLPWGDYQLPQYRRPYGVWRPVEGGYTLELRLPLRTLGPRWREAQLGLAVVDNDSREPDGRLLIWVVPQTQGALGFQAPGAPAFQLAWPDLGVNLGQRQLAVFDTRRRELFSTFADPAQLGEALRARAATLIDGLDGEGVPSKADPDGALAAAQILDERGELVGFVIEQDASLESWPRLIEIIREHPLNAAILAGAPLLLFLLLAYTFAYTRRLSRRILALVDHPGGDRDADDEIGELSRRLSDLIERDRAHREYLEQLPRILGHETLGPLGVVKMYIDDLDEHELLGHEARHERARRAIHSIEDLIEDLREATSLEQALEHGERIEVDLIDFLRDYVTTCRDAGDGALQIDLPDTRFRTVVIERRIEQLLDKLLDNAADFSDGSPVRVSVECDAAEARIRVENRGSQLPDSPSADQLFAPMWSGRKRTTERHLGLGLYVARVIAEHHGGAIRAWNTDDDHVIFEVTIPCSGASAHAS